MLLLLLMVMMITAPAFDDCCSTTAMIRLHAAAAATPHHSLPSVYLPLPLPPAASFDPSSFPAPSRWHMHTFATPAPLSLRYLPISPKVFLR